MGNAFIYEYFAYYRRRRGPDGSLSTVDLNNSANNQHYCCTLREIEEFCVWLTVHREYNRAKKINLMHNLFLVYFVNLYMFRAYLDPSSGGTTICIKQLELLILFR